VLVLGCGNDAFYKRPGFDQARYIGVDVSPAMLSAFAEAHPGTRLEAADVRGYGPTEPLDLIYSGSLLHRHRSSLGKRARFVETRRTDFACLRAVGCHALAELRRYAGCAPTRAPQVYGHQPCSAFRASSLLKIPLSR
jgi:hypothetical protein